ncbi:hypothetical protein BASA81_000020 [Batrachochytrium salamandrivorans]|nr:hypothetical protein BASA81_000020 [Batrachochytrium salamandrivorans]
MFACCTAANPQRSGEEEEELFYFGPSDPSRVPPTVPLSLKEWKQALGQSPKLPLATASGPAEPKRLVDNNNHAVALV